MSWMRVDDGLSEHPKVESLEADWRDQQRAMAAWVLVGSACSRRRTNGVVTKSLLAKTLAAWPEKERAAAAASLVACGLWEVQDDAWRYHDWAAYQAKRPGPAPSGSALSGAERMARMRARRDEDEPPERDAGDDVGDGDIPVTHSVTGDGDGDRASARSRARDPDPTRPDPSQPVRVHAWSVERFDRARPGDIGRLADHIQRRVGDAQVAHGGARPSLDTGSRWLRLAEWCVSTAAEPSRDMSLEEVIEQLAEGWAGDTWARAKGYPIGALLGDARGSAGNPQKYFAGTSGRARPSEFRRAEAVAARLVTDDDWKPAPIEEDANV